MDVYLNQAVAGVGEKDERVEVDDTYGANLIDGGLAEVIEDDDAPAQREVPLSTVEQVDTLAEGVQPAERDDEPDAEPGDDAVPDPEAPKREQAAWADAHGVKYPKSASGERIAQAIAEHLDAQGEDEGAADAEDDAEDAAE